MSKYVIVGAGAIGVTFAAQLHQARRPVALIARGAQLRAAQSGGITYVRPDGAHPLGAPIHDGPGELRLTEDDVIVIATKTQDVGSVAERWARELVTRADGSVVEAGEVLPVLTTQNGLEAERVALRHFATVIAGMIMLPAAYTEPGVVVAAGAPAVGHVWVGAHPDRADDRAEAIAADLRAADLEATAVPDISRYKHAKLIASSAFVLDALYPPGPLRDRAAHLLRDEAAAVLASAGLATVDLARELAGATRRSDPQPTEGHAYGGTSTWQSLARAGSLETGYLNGELVLQARLSGRRAPAHEAITARIHRAQRDRTPPRSLDDADLLRTLPQLTDDDGDGDQRARARVLVGAAALHHSLLAANPPAILDVRWKLGDPDGRRHFRDGHIPTAVYVDLDTELAAPASPEAGRHPLPAIRDLQDAARAWGVHESQPVVVYDDAGGLAAARAWWLLRWAGIDDVRILDGALTAWREAGLPLETGDSAADAGDVTLEPGHLPVLDGDAVADFPARGVLLDARAGERYRGEQEPVDPRAGHIPGAVSAPTTDTLDPAGTFRTSGELRRHFAALSVDGEEPIGVYCGSGVTAAHLLAALEIAGLSAALFPGSWSAWSSDPDRPVAVGADPR